MEKITVPRIQAFGIRLAAVAEQAFPGAAIQTVRAQDVQTADGASTWADLVLIEVGTASPEALGAVIAQCAQRNPQPAVILAGASIPMALARALLKLERSDVLEAQFQVKDLERVGLALLRAARPVSGAHCACWGIVGAVGGAGATTIAVETAAALAAQRDGRRGCLIDLNLADGAAPAYLGVTANMKLAAASLSPDRIDTALLDAFCTPVNDSLDLLANPRAPDAFETVTPAAVMRLLEVAAAKYDWIIIDLPRHRRAWTLDVLAGCDEILIVSELTVPALLAARGLAQEIEDEMPGHTSPGIILNRMSGRLLGPAPSVDEAQKALKRKALATVTSDWESAANAVNLGGPILQHRPRSKIVRDIAGLVRRLQTGAQDADGRVRNAG